MTSGKKTKSKIGGRNQRKVASAIHSPKKIPVQRAQTGNCFPCMKKLRSGFW